MDIVSAQVQFEGKGEDRLLVRSLGDSDATFLLAVADGLSLSDGGAAASWAIDCLGRIGEDVRDSRKILEKLREALAESRGKHSRSETTLTCGVVRECEEEGGKFLRFNFFAIGDSPVWKVVPGNSRYPFRRFLVHGPPYPAETGRVYSTIRLSEGDIWGPIAIGSVEVSSGEVLVICTDGVPERDIFVRDFLDGDREDVRNLCAYLFQKNPYCGKDFSNVLAHYGQRGVLFDDATIIAARVSPVLPELGEDHRLLAEECQAEPMSQSMNSASASRESAQFSNAPVQGEQDLLTQAQPHADPLGDVQALNEKATQHPEGLLLPKDENEFLR